MVHQTEFKKNRMALKYISTVPKNLNETKLCNVPVFFQIELGDAFKQNVTLKLAQTGLVWEAPNQQINGLVSCSLQRNSTKEWILEREYRSDLHTQVYITTLKDTWSALWCIFVSSIPSNAFIKEIVSYITSPVLSHLTFSIPNIVWPLTFKEWTVYYPWAMTTAQSSIFEFERLITLSQLVY